MAIVRRLTTYLDLVRFSHTLFALPFAVMALFLANRGHLPGLRVTVLVLLCMVAARTAAMAYNRLVDRDIDARNPRTKGRHLPAGTVNRGEVITLVIGSSAVFLTGAWLLNSLAFALSVPVLFVLLFYSHTKRFTSLSHLFLGLALGMAPLGVWVACRGDIDSSALIPAGLGLAVLCWVAGFDILYSCQDVEFDRAEGLRSIPARIGIGPGLWVARGLHASMILLLLSVSWVGELRGLYLVGVGITALLLAYEHTLVRKDDLSRVNAAFFTVNGAISILLCLFTVAESLR